MKITSIKVLESDLLVTVFNRISSWHPVKDACVVIKSPKNSSTQLTANAKKNAAEIPIKCVEMTGELLCTELDLQVAIIDNYVAKSSITSIPNI